MALDHELLKRTNSLLAEIDTVTSESTISTRVANLIECAAPAINSPIFDNYDDWELWYKLNISEEIEWTDNTQNPSATPNKCGCPRIKDKHDEELPWVDCRVQIDGAIEDIDEVIRLIPYSIHHRPAPITCGVADCACTDLFVLAPSEWLGLQREGETL